MARPRKKIDASQVEKLASIGCTQEDISYVLDCSVDTLHRRFAETIKKGAAIRNISLRRMMWKKCEAGDKGMMIWLSKQWLGYSDRVTEKSEVNLKEEVIYQSQWGGTIESKDEYEPDS